MVNRRLHRLSMSALVLLIIVAFFPLSAAANVPDGLPEGAEFVRGINFGKDATDVVIDGNPWMSMSEAQSDPAVNLDIRTAESANRLNDPITPDPAVDDDFKHMMNTYIQKEYFDIAIDQSLGSGSHYVYVWFMETYQDNGTGFHIEFEGERKGTIATAPVGKAVRYGPYEVNVADGELNTRLVYDYDSLGKAGRVRIMGMEIYSDGLTEEEPSEELQYFYRGINLGKDATAVTIGGNAWMSMSDAVSDGTVNLSFSKDVVPANTLSNPVVPNPPRDDDFEQMLNTYVYREYQNVGINQLLEPGEYTVYVWFMELYKDDVSGFHIEFEDQRKGTIATEKKGDAVRYGPYKVKVVDGQLNTRLVYDYDGLGKAGRVRIMGMEIYSSVPAPAERVKAVEATPDAGSFEGSTQVALSSMTVGAAVYYSLNDNPFQLYEGPLKFNRSTKLTTYASKEGMTDSLTTELYYKNTRMNIPKSQAPILVDGDRNEAGWTQYVSETLGAAQQLSGPNTSSVTNDVYMTWDADNLYVFADVTDPTPRINARKDVNIWDGDNLEMFFGTKDVYEEGMIKPDDRQLIISAGNDNLYHWYNADTQSAIDTIVVSSEKGYRIEAAIPWDALGLSMPEIGTELRFDIGFGDAEASKRIRQWMWNGTTQNSGDRTGWGKATLVDGIDSGVLDTLRVTSDHSSLFLNDTEALRLKAMMTNGQVVDLAGAAIQYDSQDSSILTVNNGTVTAVGYGTTQVAVTTVVNGVTLNGSITFTVLNPQERFLIGTPLVTDLKGNPLTAFGGDGFVRTRTDVTNTWATRAEVTVVAAAYDEDGELLQWASVNQIIEAHATKAVTSGFQLPDQVSSVQVFVTDSSGEQLLSDVIAFPEQEVL